MIWLRKIDFYGQIVLEVLLILSIPLFFSFGFLVGSAILGGWQLISALCNTHVFLKSGFRKQIIRYWIYSGSTLMLFSIFLALSYNIGDDLLLNILAFATTVVITGYYSSVYYKLIDHILLRREVGGVIKSNHIS